MSLDFIDDQSTLVQVMAWCRQATSHNLSQCWPRSISPNGVTQPQWVKSSATTWYWWICSIHRSFSFIINDVKLSTTELYKHHRARRFPLPNGPGQVRLPVGQVDLNRFFLFISYEQIKEFQNSWSRASDDFEKRQALHHLSVEKLQKLQAYFYVSWNKFSMPNVNNS